MSQAGTRAGGGSGVVTTINGDTGFANGPIISFNGLALGGTVSFFGDGVSTIYLLHTDSTRNTFVGNSTPNTTASGNLNSSFGDSAAQNFSSGSSNVFLGGFSARLFTQGSFNTFVGANTGLSISATSNNNVAIGFQSLSSAGIKTSNIAVGSSSLLNLGAAQNNIAIGDSSGSSYSSTESNNIIIGNSGTNSENNTIRIGTQGSGTGEQDRNFQAGIYGVTPSQPLPQFVIVDSDGQLGSTSSTGALSWVEVTSPTQAISANTGYIANNAGTIDFSLPATAALGDTFRITGINNATGWSISQGAGQQIFFGASSTTLGVGGTLSSSAIRDSVEIVCVVADTEFNVLSSIGNLTVV